MSPCVGICQLRPGSDLCDGCLRSLDEIGEWGEAPDTRRRGILANVADRLRNEAAAGSVPAAGPAPVPGLRS